MIRLLNGLIVEQRRTRRWSMLAVVLAGTALALLVWEYGNF